MNFFLPTLSVNYTAILAAAVASMILGLIWYGPLFGKTWMKLTGKKEMGKKDDMPKTYALTFIGALILSYVLAVFIGLTNTIDIGASLKLAFWVWLGFQTTLSLSSVLLEGQPWNLYFLKTGYDLANVLVIAAVLSYLK